MAAAGTVEVKVEGLDELRRQLERLGLDVNQALETAVKAAAEIVRQAAQANAPGPHIEIGDPERAGQGVEIEVGPDKEHWYYKFQETGARPHSIVGKPLHWIEQGDDIFTLGVQHPGRGAEPFLRPALDENTNRAENAAGDVLRGVIEAGRAP